MSRRGYGALLWSGVALAALHGTALLLIPLLEEGGTGRRWEAVLVALLFWATAAGQLALMWTARWVRKKREKLPGDRAIQTAPIGLLAFWKTWEGFWADLALLLGVVLQLLCGWRHWSGTMFWLSLALCAAAFQLHCLFNGRNYRYGKLWKKWDKGEWKK